MALAYLCSLLQSNLRKLPAKVRFRAFVVDHGVRSESSTEAQAVAKVLESRGTPFLGMHEDLAKYDQISQHLS